MMTESSVKNPHQQEIPENREALIALLKNDHLVQNLICEIVAGKLACTSVAEKETPSEGSEAMIEKNVIAVEKVAEPEGSLRNDMHQELAFLRSVKGNNEVSKLWLHESGLSEGGELIKLISISSQWNEILKLWDVLSNKCKQTQQKISSEELLILDTALSLHNNIWLEKKAGLSTVEVGSKYDYETCDRATTKGDKVVEILLPGLVNASDRMQKKCVVKTK